MDDKIFGLDNRLGETTEEVDKEQDKSNLDISFKNENSEDKKSLNDMETDKLLTFAKVSANASASEDKLEAVGKDEEKKHKEEPSFKTNDNHGNSFDNIKNLSEKSSQIQIQEKKNTKKTTSKKAKKKKKSRFNGSIFGGIILVTVILTVSVVLAVGGITIGMEYYGIGRSDKDISFNIPQGSSNEEIAQQLEENGIIKNQQLFLLALKIHNPETIYPGDITLQASLGYSGIIEKLSIMRESYETVTITFKEGETLLDIAKKLEENNVCEASDFLFEFNKTQNFNFESKIEQNENAFYAREGYFFPDTYEFYVGDTAYNITKIVREHFEEQITDKMYEKMDKMKLSLNEVMTLASMVQLEAGSVDEMPKVASVFLNRLDESDTFPMLQSDPTKNYIKNVISTQSDNQSTIEHYTEYYDTYQCKGLPAGPICNPGLDAIMAVLYPEDTEYYYFCNNLETGESFYAKTLDEHEKNLEKAGLK